MTVAIRSLAPPAQIGLRCDAGLSDCVRQAVGLPLPTVPNTATTAPDTSLPDMSLLWLGPDEWLLVADTMPSEKLLPALQAALAHQHASVIDLGAARAVREISGTGARDLLARGMSIDLHPRQFHPGRTAQTLLGRIQVLLHQTDAAPTYRLFVRPSFAAYLDAWLSDAKSLMTPC